MIFYSLVLPMIVFYGIECVCSRQLGTLRSMGLLQLFQTLVSFCLLNVLLFYFSAPVLTYCFDHAWMNLMMDFPFWVNIVLSLLCVTLLNYGYHRALHHSDFLWTYFHSLHHFPKTMTTLLVLFGHPIDVLFNTFLAVAITVLLLGADPWALFYILLFLNFIAFYQHSQFPTPHWLGPIISRPEMHQIHHKHEFHAFNYGIVPWWDLVFGTYRNPKYFKGSVGFSDVSMKNYFKLLCFLGGTTDKRLDRKQWFSISSTVKK